MILNIRGTHGSGKSTLVRKLLDSGTTMAAVNEDGSPSDAKRPAGYVVFGLPGMKKGAAMYVVGPYETACGGADAIQPYDLIWPRVLEYARKGHVIFEGALVSSSVGNIGREMAARRQKDCVVLFLDTPVQVCLDRIAKRRAAKGDERPLNPKNTTVKHHAVEVSRPKLEALGLRCVTLHHRKAFKELMEVILEERAQ
jgi:predicted kinase